MQKIDFDRQVQAFALQLIGALSALSPVILILAMLGAFAWVGYVDFLYFESTLPAQGLAILAAVFLQSMRFGSALGSVRMFRAGKISGILFLAASLLLTYLESAHVIEQAAALAKTPEAIKANVYLIRLAVWASIGLEILTAVLFGSMYADAAQEKESGQTDADHKQADQVQHNHPYERPARRVTMQEITQEPQENPESDFLAPALFDIPRSSNGQHTASKSESDADRPL